MEEKSSVRYNDIVNKNDKRRFEKMFDYKANPFYLNDNEIKWVEDTYEGMSLEEKLGSAVLSNCIYKR